MKYLKVFTDFATKTKSLNDAEFGRLARAMLSYADTEQEPELKGNERYAWDMVRGDIDKQIQAYKEICTINKRIATERNASLRSVTEREEPSRSVVRTKNEDKEELKKETIPKGIVKKEVTGDPKLDEALDAFIEFRKKMKKPMTERTVNLLLSNLDKLANSTSEKVEIINQSILNGWTGVYALKEDTRRRASGNVFMEIGREEGVIK